MAKAKKTALNISTGKDKSTKAQRKRAYTVAVLVTTVIVTVGIMVVCDSATPSVSSVQGSNPSVYNWKEKVANTEWTLEETRGDFVSAATTPTETEILNWLPMCDQMKIDGNLRVSFDSQYMEIGDALNGTLQFSEEVIDGEISDCSVQIAGMTFRFHFSKTETEKRVKLWLNDDVNKYLLYKQVGNNK